MDGKKLDEVLEDMARQHNQPPATPRDRMWSNIDAARAPERERQSVGQAVGKSVGQPFRQSFASQLKEAFAALLTPKVMIPVGAAAVLVLGIVIGRISYNPAVSLDGSPQIADNLNSQVHDEIVVATQIPSDNDANSLADQQDLVYQLATINLFTKADMRLTDFRTTSCSTDGSATVPDWARGLLLQTRLLLNTSGSENNSLLPLLEELELVLAQIVSISDNNCTQDMEWILRGLEKRSTLNRLRQATTNDTDFGAI